ncbi:hypothetical protein SBI_06976 [Streptomyces bingchenggensis BCW-1]|uniref:Uncharacterized protein n=1 Tax=Streptomyces bingchenggensis (strain BCW-1) TaxID=749414 RepID=D7C1N1_STRBB|nr:hypothetical protein SBI_06976 [Streptomyces bingchenggensis BCW-1]
MRYVAMSRGSVTLIVACSRLMVARRSSKIW